MKTINLLLLFHSSLLFLQGTQGLCVPRPNNFKDKKTVQRPELASAPALINASVIALCKKTNHPDLCVSAVQPYLPASGDVGAKDMLVMHINASRSRLGDANAVADKVLGETTITPEERSCLETCKENYDDANSEFDAALQAMGNSDLATLNVMLSGAMTDVGTCDDGFSEFQGLTSPLISYDEELQKLISNCLAFGTLL